MLRARPPLLHFRVFLPTQPLPRPAGVIRGAYTGAVQAYFDIFSGFAGGAPHLRSQGKAPRGRGWTFLSNCSLSAYILPKRSSEMQNLLEVTRTAENFALNTRGALKLRRFFSPALASL